MFLFDITQQKEVNYTNGKMYLWYKHKQAVSDRGPTSVHRYIKNIINLLLIREIKKIIMSCEFCFAHMTSDVKKAVALLESMRSSRYCSVLLMGMLIITASLDGNEYFSY